MFGIARAPEIARPGLAWFNVPAPLSLAQVKGRLVILDFWTFCCINCFHILPVLRRVEETYGAEVAVIGVHSPKFEHEKDPQALLRAMERYDVRHPVVHDPDMVLWQEYCVRAWPTLVFISPDGHVIGQLAGEPHPDLLVQGLGDMIEQFFQRGELAPRALNLAPPAGAETRLRFPGKIKPCPGADGAKAWAVADTGHHQVVLVDDHGTELRRFGTGRAGFQDGAADEAVFNGPEGLACDHRFIYVADTRNHAIRRIHRADGAVDTVAGMGIRGEVLRHPEPGTGAPLASPWDLALKDGVLYFANAGSHQIGALELDTGMLRPVAGSGVEEIRDGDASEAALAQPSALSFSPGGDSLFFADSETSSIRRLRLDGGAPVVETLAGHGLFDFGWRNGPLDQALFQHPLGVAALDGAVVVADSYNSALRVISLEDGKVHDLDLLQDCDGDTCRPLAEPAGVATDGPHRLLVSDTNNHRIVEMRLDLGTYRTWLA